MKKILFVTNRNIFTTCGELRLIKNRAEILFKEYGIVTDFIAFASKARINSANKETILAGGNISVFELSMSNPFRTLISYREIKEEVKKRIKSGTYSAIILSGIAMPLLTKEIRKYSNIKIVLDIHGAQEDILEVAKNGNFVKRQLFRALYKLDRNSLEKNFTYVNGCLVVTCALERYLRERYAMRDDIKFYSIPCATSTVNFNLETYMISRRKYREKYNIQEEEIVFIYSGGISSWQCIDETIKLYKTLSMLINRKTRMLIFSHNINAIKSKVKDDHRFVVDSYKPNELVYALCAGDFAFLLRKNCMTNNVAFPNKFLEYVQSGMKIISTPFLYEIADQIKKNDLGYLYDFSEKIQGLCNYIQDNAMRVISFESIREVLYNNSFEYRLKSLAKDLESYGC